MTREENIRAILNYYFTGFKDELIEGAVTLICDIKDEPKYVCNADGSIEPFEHNPKWTSVSERLPEEHTAVLIWCPQMRNIYCAYLEDNRWFIFGASIEVPIYSRRVTAWMSLPEPPYAPESEVR